MASSSSSPELLQAHVELWNLTYSYLKSMALQCAVELGIPNAVHGAGGAASVADILAAVPVPEHRKPHVPRLLRFLVVTGILALDPPVDAARPGFDRKVYRLTPLSRLLVDDVRANGCACLAPFVLSQTTRFHVGAALRLSEWFRGGGDAAAEMPFRLAHGGADPWEAMRRDPAVSRMFHDGLGADSRLAMDFVVTNCGAVFEGVRTLVDVGGGNGSSARAIASAFSRVKCSVLDLPHVIRDAQPSDGVEYIAGDMMSSIPPADAVLLKYILHDWNDEDCVKILKQCKKAICSEDKPSGGKVIIIDAVVGSPSAAKDAFEVQVAADVLMMVMTAGKERDEHEWRQIFVDAGFARYKTTPVLGFLSVIELSP